MQQFATDDLKDRPKSGGRRASIGREVLAVLVAVVGPTLRAAVVADSRAWVTALLVGLSASAALARLGPDRRRGRLAIVGVAALIQAATVPETVVVWSAMGLVLADWVIRDHPPVRRWTAGSPRDRLTMLVLTLLAAVIGSDASAAVQPLVLVAGALGLAALCGRARTVSAEGPDRTSTHREVLAAVLATTGPSVRAHDVFVPYPWLVLAIGLWASWAMGRVGAADATRRWYIAGLSAIVAVQASTMSTGLWLLAGLMLVDWAVRGRAPLVIVPPGHDASLPGAITMLALAAYRGWASAAIGPVAVFMLGAVVLTAIGSVARERLTAFVSRVSSGVGAMVSRVLFVLVGLLAVVGPWVLHRLLVLDPLSSPTRGPDSSWTVRSPAMKAGTSGWARNPSLDGFGIGVRVRRLLVVPLAIALLGVAGGLLRWSTLDRSSDGYRVAAFADAPWWPELEAEQQWALFEPGQAYNPLRFPPQWDVEGRFVNIEGGRRRTWRAPPCDCERIQVWMYGGSTTFGMGQRDLHTIASAIARRAYEDGLVVDVDNRGVLGDLQWEESQRFAWDVQAEDPPDVVLFYDGFNELQAASQRNARGEIDDYPVDWGAETVVQSEEWLRNLWIRTLAPDAPPTMTLKPKGRRMDLEELVAHSMSQYETALAMSSAVAAATGTEMVAFWQPNAFVSAGAAMGVADDDRSFADSEPGRQYRLAASLLPESVVDLTDAFDDVDRPVYYDNIHTNELGAAIVADEIYRTIRVDLQQRVRVGQADS